ncbi:hypothetical protein [Haloferax larsenii]|uniref:Uncharacterized protein n=1 Tax=Haloferax larsenii TaxID=302484 RepID=A0A1H7FWY6_HALLR|nr:hypothetical protein [Haloferax larsenii]SEK30304.1 hypothetical protein SAMN04488691_101142 [Haloferax larsenii]
MSRYSSLLDPYRDRNVATTLGVIALILSFGGFAATCEIYLGGVQSHTLSLSSFELAAFIAGGFLFDPVILFVVLFVVARRFDSPLDVQSILPGAVVAILTGSLFGQAIGTLTFQISAGTLLVGLVTRSEFWHVTSFHPFVVFLWGLALESVTADLLTVVAALSLGTLTRDQP